VNTDATSPTERKVVRRGLLAALGGIGAALAYRFATPGRAGAVNEVFMNATNVSSAQTLLNSANMGGPYPVFRVENFQRDDAVVAIGGPGSMGATGRRGLLAQGGNNAAVGGTNSGGDAIQATGGHSTGTGNGGDGLDATGGNGGGTGQGGNGIKATGGIGFSTGGNGVTAQGGSPNGIGVSASGGGAVGSQGVAIQGTTNNTTSAAIAGANQGSGPGVSGGSGAGFGVRGTTASAAGVYGVSIQNATGVKGVSNASAAPADGNGGGIGVHGKSGSGTAVQGESQSSFGVQGICFGSSVGVLGLAVNGAGVWGQSNTYVGVHGLSLGNATGVYGLSQGAGSGVVGESVGGIGTYAISRTAFVPALFAQSLAPNGVSAARFDGAVLVNGDFSVTGAKAAVVPHPDGSMRTLYAVESPESWFEDYGRTRLINGVARVTLDPDFSALVQQGDYLVFPVAEGNCNGIYVSQRDAKGFEVRECNNGKSTLPLAYRVLARRKDLAGKRLERVDARMASKPNVRNPAAERALAVVPPVRPVSGQ
jgi:hypothetical protein